MNKILTVLFVISVIITTGCGNSSISDTGNKQSQLTDTGTAKILFREYEHNFGKVSEGEKIAFVFTFENKGTSNLVVTSATTTCGCTVPKYNSSPVPPGGNGDLEVVFDTSGRNGIQTKTITVKSNASSPVVLLKITAEIVAD